MASFLARSVHAFFKHPAAFRSAPIFKGLVLPLLTAMLTLFPLCAMMGYAWVLWVLHDSPYLQSVMIGVIYPVGLIVYKQFMLGSVGGPFLFGTSINLNEEWFEDPSHKAVYCSIVRSIHGMYLPQSVGLFLLYTQNRSSFYLTCVLRLLTQSAVKAGTFYFDEQQMIIKAKKDGVFDYNNEVSPPRARERAKRAQNELELPDGRRQQRQQSLARAKRAGGASGRGERASARANNPPWRANNPPSRANNPPSLARAERDPSHAAPRARSHMWRRIANDLLLLRSLRSPPSALSKPPTSRATAMTAKTPMIQKSAGRPTLPTLPTPPDPEGKGVEEAQGAAGSA
jgi:hypothetical protein